MDFYYDDLSQVFNLSWNFFIFISNLVDWLVVNLFNFQGFGD